MQNIADTVLPNARPVRLVSFNKSGDMNWAVPWHQDRVIAVNERHDAEGFVNWTRQGGFWHCEPPVDVLKPMIFARIHLDYCDADSGALELALNTHRLGAVRSDVSAKTAEAAPHEVCTARRGDVLLVKALTLHRSRSSLSGKPRRALRVDYANTDLPAPLEWALNEAVAAE